jgi:hypothetical protein
MGTAIHVAWPSRAEPRATFVFKTEGGRLRERVVGPRALLTIAEAAAVLDRPVAHVRRAIKARLLRAVRRGGREYVTMSTCVGFLREEKADLAVARTRLHEPVRSSEEVYRQLEL